MPNICLINEIFSESDAPYSLNEIERRLAAVFGPHVTYSRVHHAWHDAKNHEALAKIVAPIPSKRKEMFFTCEGARRIARGVNTKKPQKTAKKVPILA